MKNILFVLILSSILLTGCESTLDGPPVVESVKLNTDSTRTGHFGKYQVCLKSSSADPLVFYSYVQYNSGETLTTMSELQWMVREKTGAYLDTITNKNRKIEKLTAERNALEKQLEEKTLLIRFLTGK